MKEKIKKILLSNISETQQLASIMEVIADYTDNEKMKMWRERCYHLENKLDKLEDKYDKAIGKLIEIQKIIMVK